MEFVEGGVVNFKKKILKIFSELVVIFCLWLWRDVC